MFNKKGENQKIHFKRRLYERYSIMLNDQMHSKLVKKIQNCDGLHMNKISNRLSFWVITFENRFIPVLYDKKRSKLVTALPQNCYQLNGKYKYAS